MTTDADYETALRAADQALRQAQTADDVRTVWRTYTGSLGHRTLGRLLIGQSADRLLERRSSREE